MKNKQAKRKTLRTTDWEVGQPLAFPPSHTGIKSVAVEAAPVSGPISSKRQKHKKEKVARAIHL